MPLRYLLRRAHVDIRCPTAGRRTGSLTGRRVGNASGIGSGTGSTLMAWKKGDRAISLAAKRGNICRGG
ncbi:unnamed protein product, partial [Ectocarpus sp. 4 AP-2014]